MIKSRSPFIGQRTATIGYSDILDCIYIWSVMNRAELTQVQVTRPRSVRECIIVIEIRTTGNPVSIGCFTRIVLKFQGERDIGVIGTCHEYGYVDCAGL